MWKIKINMPYSIKLMLILPFLFINKKREKDITEIDMRHERIHARQQLEMFWVIFFVVYLIELIFKGYGNISFEREAYINESSKDYLKSRRFWSWTKYLKK